MSIAPEPELAGFARAVLALARRLRAARPPESVSVSALGLLSSLRREGPMPAVRLARIERLAPQSLSRLIAQLEASGLIARTPGDADRRTLVIAITPEGRRLLRRDLQARVAWLDQAMLQSLTSAERKRLIEAAELMLRVADQAPKAARDDV